MPPIPAGLVPSDLASNPMVDLLGNVQALKPQLKEKPTSPTTTAGMIKAVGGLGNWYKLFPAKVGKWTQVTMAQIRTVEANQVPKPLHVKPAAPFVLQGSFQTMFGTGAKSNAVYALATRKDPRLGELSAWYTRDVDVARIVGSGLKKVNAASGNYAVAAAQDMAIQASVNQAKANIKGGPVAPTWLPPAKMPGVKVPPIQKPKIKPPPVAWYEVTEALILKVEKELPSKPSMAPIPMPTGANFTAELLAGPKTKWPYAKVVMSNNGTYTTLWFTIGMAGKNKPGSIILLKRPKVAGSTPTPSLAPAAGYVESTSADTGMIRQQPRDLMDVSVMPLTDDASLPPGFGEGVVAGGGFDVEIGDAVLSDEKPFWKNPLVWAGAAALVGGVWYVAKRK